ncbi:MAG: hypothetical protein ABR509_00895 [Candidatus Limnocylindria bacterium]
MGMSQGVPHGGRGGSGKTHLDTNAALFDEEHRDHDERDSRVGLLNRVPGWVILAVVAASVAAIILFTDFAY